MSSRRNPVATIWRIRERHSFLPRSAPTPKVGSGRCPKRAILSVSVPAQDVDQVRRAEPLARAVTADRIFVRILRAVDTLRRIKADVAVAAGLDPLPEVIEQRHPPAGRRLAVAEQGVEPLVLPPLALGPASSSSMNCRRIRMSARP